jgi:hypothetical protein
VTTHVDLQYIDSRGSEQVVHAAVHDSGAWTIHATLDGDCFSRQCDGWQAVERTVFWLRHAHSLRPRPLRPAGAVAALFFMMLIGAGTVAFAQPGPAESPEIRTFVAATYNYAWLHRRLEASLPTLDVNANPDTIHRLVQQMAAAVRAARPNAQAGDFFTEGVAGELRARIADALVASNLNAADLREAEAREGIDPAMVRLDVNGAFPWMHATAMFPCVLSALPQLPPELQYRIVGNTLVLVDVHASLIVDVLPYVLADTER